MSSYRLVTQNLIASAAQAVSGTPTRTAVEDLASLINTVSMYDGLVVLGDPEIWAEYARQSPLVEYLASSKLLNIRRLDDSTIHRVARLSRLHLASATNAKDLPAIERFLEASYLARLCYPALIMHSDEHVDLAAGREWILTAPAGHELDDLIKQDLGYSRSAYFYVRTFFYAAYMDVAQLDFTADRIRAERCYRGFSTSGVPSRRPARQTADNLQRSAVLIGTLWMAQPLRRGGVSGLSWKTAGYSAPGFAYPRPYQASTRETP